MSYIHKWTPEEDDYLLLADKNGVPMIRMAKRVGVHRDTIKRRLIHLRKVHDDLMEKEVFEHRLERAFRAEQERLENREPPPFVLWMTGMIRLARRNSPES